jgi:hypothetical protein
MLNLSLNLSLSLSQETCSPIKIDQALSKSGGFGAEVLSELRNVPKYTVTIKVTEDDNKKPVAKACITIMVCVEYVMNVCTWRYVCVCVCVSLGISVIIK